MIDKGSRSALKVLYPVAHLQTLENQRHLAPLLASDNLMLSACQFSITPPDRTASS